MFWWGCYSRSSLSKEVIIQINWLINMIRSLTIILLILTAEHGTVNSSSLHPSTAGATTATTPHHATTASKRPSRSTSQRPSTKIREMSLLLRWTSEMNRRLQATATASSEEEYDVSSATMEQLDTTTPVVTDPLRGGQTAFSRIPTALVVVSNNNSKNPVAPSDKSDLTIFHAKTPRTGRRGVARWGPDLEKYLHKLADLLEVKEGSIEWTLALLYLDRACSVETPRRNGTPASPFVGPRTVHRLVLAALVLAVRATRADDERVATIMNQYYSELSSALGIPDQHLSLMVEWMQEALGDLGLFVAPYQVQEFAKKWNLRFGQGSEEIEVDACPQPLSYPLPQGGRHHHHHQQQQFSEAKVAQEEEEPSQSAFIQGGHSYHPNDQRQHFSSVLHA